MSDVRVHQQFILPADEVGPFLEALADIIGTFRGSMPGGSSTEVGEVEAADVLDHMANPHPRMWKEAKWHYERRNLSDTTRWYWLGFLSAMCAATGYDRHYFYDKLETESRQEQANGD